MVGRQREALARKGGLEKGGSYREETKPKGFQDRVWAHVSLGNDNKKVHLLAAGPAGPSGAVCRSLAKQTCTVRRVREESGVGWTTRQDR